MSDESYISKGPGGMTFAGPRGVALYRATVIKHALLFYDRTGMKVNKAYTPKNMMKAASEITGHTYKPREYLKAADDLGRWIIEQSQTIPVVRQ